MELHGCIKVPNMPTFAAWKLTTSCWFRIFRMFDQRKGMLIQIRLFCDSWQLSVVSAIVINI